MTSDEQVKASHRSIPTSEAFRAFIASGWADRSAAPVSRAPVADHAARRRAALSRRFPGERLIIPAGA